MSNPQIPKEYIEILDPDWLEERKNELSELINKEILEGSFADKSIADMFRSLSNDIKKRYITLETVVSNIAARDACEDTGIDGYRITVTGDKSKKFDIFNKMGYNSLD